MKSRTVFTIFAVMLVSILMASQALAAGSYYTYNLTVPILMQRKVKCFAKR